MTNFINNHLIKETMKEDYNTKMDKNLEAFIMLRIEGKSFDELAKELNTTKQTLIDWNKKAIVRNAINEGKAFKINSLVKTFKFDLSTRVETYLKLSKKINDELLSRDLKDINTDLLLKMSIANDSRVRELISKASEIGTNPNISKPGKNADGYFKIENDE